MARNTLTMADRIKIITLMEQNMSQVDVANILHLNQSIVSRLWRKFQETQLVAYRPCEGCPCKTTPGQDRYVRLSACRNPITSATTLRHELHEATGVVVSSQTVRNRLHDIGLHARRPLKTQHSVHITGVLVQDGLEHMRIGHKPMDQNFILRRSENGPTPWQQLYSRMETNRGTKSSLNDRGMSPIVWWFNHVLGRCHVWLPHATGSNRGKHDCCSIWEHPPTHSKWFCRDCRRRVHSIRRQCSTSSCS